MATRVAIFGDGGMGTACALVLAGKPGHQVALWSAFPDYARFLAERRENVKYLPGVRIPDSVRITSDVEQAASGAQMLVLAIPTVYMRATLQRVRPYLRHARPAVSVAKGIEDKTFLRPSEIVHETLGDRPVGALSGPSHAEEVARMLPATVVAASGDLSLARQVQALFSTERLRVYTNVDILGVELAGALKNIIGIAAGICDGLGFGDNAKAALLTRALVEITRFGEAMGAEARTFYGLAGIGDMITTCISPYGRNRAVGHAIGSGRKLADILDGMEQVAEGVATTRAVHDLAERTGVDMPITTEVYRVLFEDKAPLAAVTDLMLRQPKAEADGAPM